FPVVDLYYPFRRAALALRVRPGDFRSSILGCDHEGLATAVSMVVARTGRIGNGIQAAAASAAAHKSDFDRRRGSRTARVTRAAHRHISRRSAASQRRSAGGLSGLGLEEQLVASKPDGPDRSICL